MNLKNQIENSKNRHKNKQRRTLTKIDGMHHTIGHAPHSWTWANSHLTLSLIKLGLVTKWIFDNSELIYLNIKNVSWFLYSSVTERKLNSEAIKQYPSKMVFMNFCNHNVHDRIQLVRKRDPITKTLLSACLSPDCISWTVTAIHLRFSHF